MQTAPMIKAPGTQAKLRSSNIQDESLLPGVPKGAYAPFSPSKRNIILPTPCQSAKVCWHCTEMLNPKHSHAMLEAHTQKC